MTGREPDVSYAIPNDTPAQATPARATRGRVLRAAPLAAAAFLAASCSGAPAPAPSPSASQPSPPPSPSPLPDPLPEVVARVNGTPIPLRSARIIVDQAYPDRAPTPAQKAAEYRRAVEQLVVRELLRQEAAVRGIKADPAAVDRLAAQVRSEHADDAAFRKFLAAQGLDPRTFREELRVRDAVEKVVKQETEKVPATIPEAEAREYYAANVQLFESGGRPLPFEAVRERIQDQVVTFRRQEALNGLLVRLRAAARIEKYL